MRAKRSLPEGEDRSRSRPARTGTGPVRRELERRIETLPGIERRPSRYGDSDSYFSGAREIAHFHGDGRMDVRLTKERIRELRSLGPLDPRLRARGPSAEWISMGVARPTDIPFAVTLVEDAIRANE